MSKNGYFLHFFQPITNQVTSMYCIGEGSDLSEVQYLVHVYVYCMVIVLVTKCMVMTYLTKSLWILSYTAATWLKLQLHSGRYP